MSRFFELTQQSERYEALGTRGRRGSGLASTQVPPANELLDTDLPFLGARDSLAMPRPSFSERKASRALSLRSLAEAGFRYPRWLIGIASLTMLVTILAILCMPRRYQATMRLVVLSPRQFMSSNPEEVAKASSGITGSDMNAQAELLRSRDVLNQALDQLGPLASPALGRDQAIDALGKMLDVAPVPGSNVLKVSFTDSSPEQAKNMLQGVASSFVSRELALLRPSHQQVFADLVAQDQRELTAAQQDLARFKAALGIASSGEAESGPQRQLENSSAANLSTIATSDWIDEPRPVEVPQRDQQAELDRLQQRVTEVRRNLDLAAQKRDLAVIDDALDKDRILNFAFAAKPSADSMPVQPRPLPYLGLGLLTAMILSIGFCAGAELTRNTVCSPAELEALTGFPTLAVVPMQPSGSRMRRQRNSQGI